MAVSFVLLVFMVVFVNGFTDAPNAVASCISSRTMSERGAILLAGVCNFLGAIVASLFFSGVAETVYLIVDFGDNDQAALSALLAAMCAVVVWSMIAFVFGIPTSESHALISGVLGAAFATRMSLDAVRLPYIALVFVGLVVSTIPAFYIAKWFYSAIIYLFAPFNSRKLRYFLGAQKMGVASSAFLHGAQDSQKFVGVLMLGMRLYSGGYFSAPIGVSVACAAVMTAGTFIGGSRIIKKVGEEMVSLDAPAGASADAASSIVLLICTILGIPVSTTHSKTSAMMGAGKLTAAGLDKGVARQMVFAWVLTFPLCALLGFLFGLIVKGA